jgi:Cu(I)/Ag(I) efflux system protein CusF
MKTIITIASIALCLATPAIAQMPAHDHAAHMAANSELVPAEVRALDLKAGKITLKHGDLKNLGMPGMTMVFAIQKGLALPKDLKVGDKVRVRAEEPAGVLTLTTIER